MAVFTKLKVLRSLGPLKSKGQASLEKKVKGLLFQFADWIDAAEDGDDDDDDGDDNYDDNGDNCAIADSVKDDEEVADLMIKHKSLFI